MGLFSTGQARRRARMILPTADAQYAANTQGKSLPNFQNGVMPALTQMPNANPTPITVPETTGGLHSVLNNAPAPMPGVNPTPVFAPRVAAPVGPIGGVTPHATNLGPMGSSNTPISQSNVPSSLRNALGNAPYHSPGVIPSRGALLPDDQVDRYMQVDRLPVSKPPIEIGQMLTPNDVTGTLERINAARATAGNVTPVGVHDLLRSVKQRIADTLEPQTPAEDTFGDQMYRAITHTRPAWAPAPEPVMRAPRTWGETIARRQIENPGVVDRLNKIIEANRERAVENAKYKKEAETRRRQFFDRVRPRHDALRNAALERRSKAGALQSIKRANRLGRLSARRGGNYKETRNAALSFMRPELARQQREEQAAGEQMKNYGLMLSALSNALSNASDPESIGAIQQQIKSVMDKMVSMRAASANRSRLVPRPPLPPIKTEERTTRPPSSAPQSQTTPKRRVFSGRLAQPWIP